MVRLLKHWQAKGKFRRFLWAAHSDRLDIEGADLVICHWRGLWEPIQVKLNKNGDGKDLITEHHLRLHPHIRVVVILRLEDCKPSNLEVLEQQLAPIIFHPWVFDQTPSSFLKVLTNIEYP